MNTLNSGIILAALSFVNLNTLLMPVLKRNSGITNAAVSWFQKNINEKA